MRRSETQQAVGLDEEVLPEAPRRQDRKIHVQAWQSRQNSARKVKRKAPVSERLCSLG